MLKLVLGWFFALAILLIAQPLPAIAAPVETPHARVDLVSEVETIRAGESFSVALKFELQEGWHIYWRNPGDSGAKPTVDWMLPSEFEVGDIQWPYPERLPAGPLLNFGYEGEVLLPSSVTPPADLEAGAAIALRAEADWLVCKIDCIPESGTLELQLPIGTTAPKPDPRWAEQFERTRASLPNSSPWAATANATEAELFLQIALPASAAARIERASFFPDFDGAIVNAAEQIFTADRDGLRLRLQRGYLPELDILSGVLTLEETTDLGTIVRAFTIAPLTVVPGAPVELPTAVKRVPLWQTFGLAFLGGIVLNLMPCVFPVLSLKALGIVQKSQKHPRQVRLQVLAFTIGVLTSLIAVASCLLVLRSLGQQIGWGFQLQSPAFVLLLAYLLFGIGLNLSGVFVFGASWMGVGQRLTERPGYAGEFFSGILATVVATPCTAPFMATAIGAALTQPAPIAIAIFASLGLGLALPYGAIALLPGLQRRLPKPGAWMETLQQLLAFPMYGAAAWLVWVLVQQAGTDSLAVVLGGFIVLGFAAWLYQKTRQSPRLMRQVGAVAALALLGFALTLARLPVPVAIAPEFEMQENVIPWEPYSAERLAELRQQGRAVFVNFTADWCITCLVNDRSVLRQPEIIAAFAAQDIAYLKGDWTNRDRVVTEALESFGRSGVPLYVFYSPDRAPKVLPQILSVKTLRDLLEA